MKHFSVAFLAPALHSTTRSDVCVRLVSSIDALDDAKFVEHLHAPNVRPDQQTSGVNTIFGPDNPLLLSSDRPLDRGIMSWLVPSANAAEPTKQDIELLRKAMGALYGEGGSPATAEPLLNQVVDIWGKQPADERAALFKVRGDCYLRLTRMDDAVRDYTAALDLLDSPEGELADPAERPAARLGRARAIMSIKGRVDGTPVTKEMARKAAEDYSISLKLSARDDDFDTDDEMIEDGAARNPYAAWEMGTARRAAGDFAGAYKAHVLASDSFENIGDHARSVISFLDAGIDLAAVGDLEAAKEILEPAIKSSVGVESNDVELLERVVSKEGEARIAYASILWNANDKSRAEAQLGEACLRLDQLEKDASERKLKAKKSDNMQIEDLGYSIDDIIPQGGEISCSRFKNEKFLSSTVSWPQSLKEKVLSLQKLK